MKNCIFCKIINNEIPSYKIYENENTFAFLDISDDVLGHTLVVSKKHVKNILESDQETINEVMKTVKLISSHYINDCGFDGVHILSNNEPSAEQSVMHMHFHILPRKANDNLNFYPKLEKLNSDLKSLYEKLKLN